MSDVDVMKTKRMGIVQVAVGWLLPVLPTVTCTEPFNSHFGFLQIQDIPHPILSPVAPGIPRISTRCSPIPWFLRLLRSE